MADSARLLVFRPTSTPGRCQLVANSTDAPFGVVEARILRSAFPRCPVTGSACATMWDAATCPSHHPSAFVSDVFGGVMGNLMLGETTGPGGDHGLGLNSFDLANVSATLTAPDPARTSKKKCKKKREEEGKGPAYAAGKKKKKKCKKRKRKRRPAS